jgi:hypothetical protein
VYPGPVPAKLRLPAAFAAVPAFRMVDIAGAAGKRTDRRKDCGLALDGWTLEKWGPI